MNLFLREMKKNRTSFLIWLILMILVNAMMLTSFGSVAEMAENTEAMLSQYPKEFVEAMNLDILKMTNTEILRQYFINHPQSIDKYTFLQNSAFTHWVKEKCSKMC